MPAAAGVTSSIVNRDYQVSGTTASGLVRFMNGNPLRGDNGNAYASIHPNYRLDVSTREKAGVCRAEVDIDIRFTLTLPKASTAAMSRSTRSAWNNFVSFAKRHEEHHRQSYVGCARAFVARAERLSEKQCFALSAEIRRQFSQMKRDCEAKQREFDRSQIYALARLSLFSMAQHQRR